MPSIDLSLNFVTAKVFDKNVSDETSPPKYLIYEEQEYEPMSSIHET